jgi:N6-L-threonylcarbamoyladenine synthase
MEKIDWIVQKAIDDSGKKIEEIDAVASTAGPGLNSMFVCWFKFWKSFCFCVGKTIYCC